MIRRRPDEPTAALLDESAYLVARGVRALALVGRFPAFDTVAKIRLATLVEQYAHGGVTPFVLEVPNGMVDCGYAAASWVLDLYRWIVTDDAVPESQRTRIIGLMLGYSAGHSGVRGRRRWPAILAVYGLHATARVQVTALVHFRHGGKVSPLLRAICAVSVQLGS